MKRLLAMLIGLLLIVGLATAAAAPGFVVLDQTLGTIQVVDGATKTLTTLNFGPRPSNLIALPGANGYLVLYRGSSASGLSSLFSDAVNPGGLVYLDQNFKPTNKKIKLPGVVISDYYLPASATWIILSTTGNSETPQGRVTLIDLKSGSNRQFELDSLPGAWRLTPDQQQLAVATLGKVTSRLEPKLFLINLATLEAKSFPVSLNPGGIYFMNNYQIMVACGGYNAFQKYSETVLIQRPEQSVAGQLHLIDPATGQTKAIPSGYAPLVVCQDQSDPDLFYVASSNKVEPDRPTGKLQKLSASGVVAELDLPGPTFQMTQTKLGRLCLLGETEFCLIDPAEPRLVTKISYELQPEELCLNPAGTIAYLTTNSSSYLEIINLESGSHSQLKFSNPYLLGEFSSGNWSRPKLLPVMGFDPLPNNQISNRSRNQRMVLLADQNLLCLVSGMAVNLIDTSSNQIKSRVNYKGRYYGIHAGANPKLIILSTDEDWYFIDLNQTKPQVRPVTISRNQSGPAYGYYNPDHSRLVVCHQNRLYLLDTLQGKYLGSLATKADDPVIVWPN